ncbi:MAG: copper chaperone PCu(A)C [Candidatus Nanopelagicales bacterium]
MRKLMVALAAAGALALAGCSSDSASTTESSAPATDAAVTVTDAWIPQPASDTSAMFGMVSNSGSEAVSITGGSAPDVGMVQVHEFVKEGNKEVMQEVPGGLEIPAGGSVTLQPGGYHVMMMDVTADWQVGDEVPVTLEFTNNETVEVTAVVKAREGMNPDEATMDEGSMDMEASPSS